jgi:maleamate amidohydrolase
MNEERVRAIYEQARFGQALNLGVRPSVLVVDFSQGFTDPSSPLGADLSAPVIATKRLLDEAREHKVSIIFTTVGYEANMKDLGIWAQKSPAMTELVMGSRWVEIDSRLKPQEDEPIIVKKGASAFFGTNLTTILTTQGTDTVILCGATTSGCVRATAIDLLQYGFPTLVPRECVGDRAEAPHEANLFDIQAKYADVVALEEALKYLQEIKDAAHVR